MAGRRSNPTGQAVYRLNFELRLPGLPDANQKITHHHQTSGIWVPAGSEVLLSDMRGLNVAALERGGHVVKIADAEVACSFCAEHGTAKQKKERYSSKAALEDHYRDAHPGVASLEEV